MHFSIPETETRAGDGGAAAYVVSGAEGAELSRGMEPSRGAEWVARPHGPSAVRPRWGRAGPQPRCSGGSGSGPGPGPGPGEAGRSRPTAIPSRRPVPGPGRDWAPSPPRLRIGRGRSLEPPRGCPDLALPRAPRAGVGSPQGPRPVSSPAPAHPGPPVRPSVYPGFLFCSLRRERLRRGAGGRCCRVAVAIECPDPFPWAGSGGQSPQAGRRVRISALGVRVGSPGLHDPAETPTLLPCAEIPLRGIPLGEPELGHGRGGEQ